MRLAPNPFLSGWIKQPFGTSHYSAQTNNWLPQPRNAKFRVRRRNAPSLVEWNYFLEVPIIRRRPKTARNNSGMLNLASGAWTVKIWLDKSTVEEKAVFGRKPTTVCYNPGILNSGSGIKTGPVWLNETTFCTFAQFSVGRKLLATTGGC